MKNLLIALVLALPSAAHATATAAVAPVLNSPSGSYVSASQAPNLAYIGAPVYRVEVAVDTPVLLVAGAGMLYGVQCGSGTSSGYEITYDSAVTSGITVATTGKALHAPVYSPGLASAASNVGLLDLSVAPAAFSNGLVALTHGAAVSCYIRARLNTGANPGP